MHWFFLVSAATLGLSFGLPGASRAEVGRLQVGFAEVDATPAVDGKTVYLAGFGQNRKATGVLDPIMIRTLVLRDETTTLAMVSVDVIGLFLEFTERVRKRVPQGVQVLISATHNHEGPDTMGLWGPSPIQSGVDPAYLKLLEDKIVQSIQAAIQTLTPATARIGTTRAPELLSDTREPYVKHDELVAIRFFDARQQILGTLVQWNCHPETLDDKNTLLSADYVASLVAEVKAKSNGKPVIYLTGTVGGLMTSLGVELRDEKGQRYRNGTVEMTVAYGKALAKVVHQALDQSQPVQLTPIRYRSAALLLPMDNKLYQLGWQLGVLKREVYEWTGQPQPAEFRPSATLPKRPAIRTEVGWMRWGEVEIAVLPGEVYPELVLNQVQNPADPAADFPDAPIEPAIYDGMKAKYRMLIGLGNDEIGYILPKRQWDEKPPFCYGRKKAQYGEVNSIGPETAPILCRIFRDLAQPPAK